MGKLLFNFQHWETKMRNLEPKTLPCNFGQLIASHTRVNIVEGHVAFSASLLDLPLRLQSLVNYSASSAVYVGYDTCVKRFRTKIDRWFKNQGFPLQIVQRFLEEFFPVQWHKRNETLATQPWRLTAPLQALRCWRSTAAVASPGLLSSGRCCFVPGLLGQTSELVLRPLLSSSGRPLWC